MKIIVKKPKQWDIGHIDCPFCNNEWQRCQLDNIECGTLNEEGDMSEISPGCPLLKGPVEISLEE